MCIKPGDVAPIFSYKHNKRLHRVWKHVEVLSVSDKCLIVANNRTKVIESDGRNWVTREPAICYFFKDYWFNIIAMIKQDGVHYYCNLSSPYVYDGEAIKYIDYDLDVKIFPDYSYTILDRDEYNQHKRIMDYPEKLKEVIENQLNILLNMINNRFEPFNHENVKYWYNIYTKTQIRA